MVINHASLPLPHTDTESLLFKENMNLDATKCPYCKAPTVIREIPEYEDEREGLELELDKHQEKVLMPLDKANLYKEVERGIRHFTQEGYTIEEIDDFYNLVDKAYDEEVITKRKYKILTNKLEKAEERLEGND